ncbi:hypothetical protein TSUD_92790 [Trifolium subterraneum]|uniref:Uncharacterized protein n=1 Tax=Trifolium subterraneum TaxID=3900 RepID=A0A2Z6PBF5_TRISU|nr:hypothetical protein TSUD_92790 [Trifolium subterraneum]
MNEGIEKKHKGGKKEDEMRGKSFDLSDAVERKPNSLSVSSWLSVGKKDPSLKPRDSPPHLSLSLSLQTKNPIAFFTPSSIKTPKLSLSLSFPRFHHHTLLPSLSYSHFVVYFTFFQHFSAE